MANRFIDAQRIIRIFGEKYEILIPDDPGYYEKLFTRRAFLLFRQEEYEEALEAYSMAIVYASDVKYLAQMLTSRSYTYLKLGDAGPYFVNIDRFFAAYIDASEALKLDPNSFRALFFKGKALAALGFYSKARDCYKDLLKLIQKEDKSVNEAIAAIDGKKEYHTVQSECLENYDPLHSDPPEFSREIFTGELNRYLLNSNNFVDPENRHLFPYDPKTWKSADELYHIFLGRAMEESEKKNFEIAISYLDFAQALDLEPTDHICLKNIKDVCDCVPKIVGINPGLALFRADLFLMLEKHYLAVIGSTYASMKFIEALKYCKQTNYFTTWVFCSKFVSETLNIMAYYESGAYSFVRNCLEDFEKCLNEFTDFLTDGSCEKNQMYKLRTCVLEIKKGLTGEKPDACIDKRIIDFIEADYEKMKQEFDNFNEPDECNQFGKIAKTLKKAGHHAWNSIFPTEFLLKEVQADIAQTAKIY